MCSTITLSLGVDEPSVHLARRAFVEVMLGMLHAHLDVAHVTEFVAEFVERFTQLVHAVAVEERPERPEHAALAPHENAGLVHRVGLVEHRGALGLVEPRDQRGEPRPPPSLHCRTRPRLSSMRTLTRDRTTHPPGTP